jgi:hypothetical protein
VIIIPSTAAGYKRTGYEKLQCQQTLGILTIGVPFLRPVKGNLATCYMEDLQRVRADWTAAFQVPTRGVTLFAWHCSHAS